MANKRQIKQYINMNCADLFAECIAASLYSAKANEENVEALLRSIIKMENDFICRVSHPEPGMTAKRYFNDLITKFNASAVEITDQINNLN
ncbi:MAG: hypothetical protein J6K19_07295 [Prevotella sp.]|nr:hypothetical protein [Prevotella sp.]